MCAHIAHRDHSHHEWETCILPQYNQWPFQVPLVKGGAGAPDRVISRPAADSSLPTRALASLKASASMGPEGGTPTCHSFVRPG